MRLLLDTHVLLWSLLEPERLTAEARGALEDPDNTLWLSSISVWECFVLAQKGRISLSPDAETWLRDVLTRLPLREAPVNHEVALQSRTLALPHEDPADRFLVATAKVYDLVLVTADRRILEAAECDLLSARPHGPAPTVRTSPKVNT